MITSIHTLIYSDDAPQRAHSFATCSAGPTSRMRRAEAKVG